MCVFKDKLVKHSLYYKSCDSNAASQVQLVNIQKEQKRKSLLILFLTDHLCLKCDPGQRFSPSNFPGRR